MAEELYLPRIAQSSPRGSVSSRSSVVYSGRQVPLVELASSTFQGGDTIEPPLSHREMPSSRSRSRHEDEYVAPSTSRGSNADAMTASLPRAAASWHAGNGSAAGYDSSPQMGVTDDSAIMEASDPALFHAAVEEHARRLGVDPAVDAEFLWIARESLVAPLPDGWYHVTATETGQPYYYNEISGESRWDHPSDDHFRQVFRELKQKQMSKAHALRPAGYYDAEAAYPSGMAWQENERDHQVQYAAQTQAGWDRRQAEAYYQGYEASYKAPPALLYSPREEEEVSVRYPVADVESTPVSPGRQQNGTPRGESQLVRKLQEMEEQKTKDDEAMAGMQSEVAELKQQLARREEALGAVKGEVGQLQGKLREVEQQLDERAKERDEIVAASQALKRELALARSGMEGSTIAHEELLEEHQALTKELALAKAKLREVQLKQRGEAEDVESLQSQLESEQSARAQLEQQLEQATKQQSGMTSKFEAAQATIRRLQEDLARKRETEQKENEEAVTAAAVNVKALEDQLADKEKALEAERARAVSLAQELEQLQASQATTKETLEQGLQKQLGTAVADADACRKELEAAKVSLTSIMAEKVALGKQLEELKVTSAAQVSELEDQQRTLKREFRAMERELKTQQSLSKERGDEFASLKLALESAEVKLSSVAQTIQKERMEAFAEAQHAVSSTVYCGLFSAPHSVRVCSRAPRSFAKPTKRRRASPSFTLKR
jgi:predicted  nucleic acid-binding Zn-ribbon protein